MKRAASGFRGLVIAALLLVLGILFFEKTAVVVQAGQSSVHGRHVYTSVKVLREDTLEDIAGRYNDGLCATDEDYIDAIVKMNGMKGTDLYPGCYITVVSSIEDTDQ